MLAFPTTMFSPSSLTKNMTPLPPMPTPSEDPDAIVDVWDQGAEGQWQGGAQDTLKRGWRAVISSGCWFLEYPPPWATAWGWENNYACDPQNVSVPPEQLARIIGGHASRWGETTDGDNWFDHVFPSLAGVAEKLWSPL
jgi:hexosaminidase